MQRHLFLKIYIKNELSYVIINYYGEEYSSGESNKITFEVKNQEKILIKRYGFIELKYVIQNQEDEIISLIPENGFGKTEIKVTAQKEDYNFTIQHMDIASSEYQVIETKDVLSKASGTYIGKNSMGQDKISIWGSDFQQIEVFVDGIKLNRLSDNSVDLSIINSDEIESIEINKGVQLGEQGTGAIGGQINIYYKEK